MRVDSRSIFAAIPAALLLIGSATPPGLLAQTSEWRIQGSAEGLTPCDRPEAPASGDSVVVREAETDTLFVADAARKWTVFDPELTYRRTFTAPVHYASESTHLWEGTILTSRFVGGSRASFGSFDLSSESVRTFGPDAGPRARVHLVARDGGRGR